MSATLTEQLAIKANQIEGDNKLICGAGYRPLGTLVKPLPRSSAGLFNEFKQELSGGQNSRQLSLTTTDPIELATMALEIEFTVTNDAAAAGDYVASPNGGNAYCTFSASNQIDYVSNTAVKITNKYYPSADLLQNLRTLFWVIDPLKLIRSIQMRVNGGVTDISNAEILGQVSEELFNTILGEHTMESPCVNPYAKEYMPVTSLDVYEHKGVGLMMHGRNKELLKSFPMDTDSSSGRYSQTYRYAFPLRTDFNKPGTLLLNGDKFDVTVYLSGIKERALQLLNPGIDVTSSTVLTAANLTALAKFVPKVTVDSVKLRYRTLDTRRIDCADFRDVRAFIPRLLWVDRKIIPAVQHSVTAALQSYSQAITVKSIPLYIIAAFIRNDTLQAAPVIRSSNNTQYLYEYAPDSFNWWLPDSSDKWRISVSLTPSGKTHDIELDGGSGFRYDDALKLSYQNFIKMMKMGSMHSYKSIPSFELWRATTPCLCVPLMWHLPDVPMVASSTIVNDLPSDIDTIQIDYQIPGVDNAPSNLRHILFTLEERAITWPFHNSINYINSGTVQFPSVETCGANVIMSQVRAKADLIQGQ